MLKPILFFALFICAALAQERNVHVTKIDRFAGSVRLRGQDRPIKVLIQNWTIDERQTVPVLPLPANGTIVAQVRGAN